MVRNWNKWFKCAGIRAVKTFAQTIVALLPASRMAEALMKAGIGACVKER